MNPFQFDSLVWDWSIAIYLFLLGISAGSTLVSILAKRRVLGDDAANSGILKATAFMAPLSVAIGLSILVIHLTKPLAFWKLMFNFNFNSVMSMGVVLFQIYMAFLVVWLAVIFKTLLGQLIDKYLPFLGFVKGLLDIAKKFMAIIEPILLFLALCLGAYTGFLLSALKTYPMLNNPVLPWLFLCSGLSSGIAACILAAITVFKDDPHHPAIGFVHKLEVPVVFTELLLLGAFCGYLAMGDAQQIAAIMNAIGGGFWAMVFWIGIIGLGIILPLMLTLTASKEKQHQKGHLVLVCSLGLLGIFCLRFFILYAGQMTVV